PSAPGLCLPPGCGRNRSGPTRSSSPAAAVCIPEKPVISHGRDRESQLIQGPKPDQQLGEIHLKFDSRVLVRVLMTAAVWPQLTQLKAAHLTGRFEPTTNKPRFPCCGYGSTQGSVRLTVNIAYAATNRNSGLKNGVSGCAIMYASRSGRFPVI